MGKNAIATPFGKKLRVLRLENDLSLQNLANIFGMSQSNLSDIELGKRAVPDKLVENICLKFDLSYREKEDFFLLASMSKPVLKIQLGNASDNKRKFAIDLVAAFPDLSEETVWLLFLTCRKKLFGGLEKF